MAIRRARYGGTTTESVGVRGCTFVSSCSIGLPHPLTIHIATNSADDKSESVIGQEILHRATAPSENNRSISFSLVHHERVADIVLLRPTGVASSPCVSKRSPPTLSAEPEKPQYLN